MRTIVWFRGKDLRLSDHLPLLDAIRTGDVVPLFVVDPYFFAKERAIELPNRMQFLVESLAEVADGIAELGSRLLFVAGKSTEVVPLVAKAFEAERVVGHRWSEPFGQERDRRVAVALKAQGQRLELFEGETMTTPGEVLTGGGTPFAVFTPFSRAFAKAVKVGDAKRAPKTLPPLPAIPAAVNKMLVSAPTLKSIGVERNENLTPAGEKATHARIKAFLHGPAKIYETGRNAMGRADTSRLSQDLKFGTISPRELWLLADKALADHPEAKRVYLNELVWREFAYDVLRHKPSVLKEPFRPLWEDFPWRKDERGWEAWVKGQTGYPVVDASARQLLATGFVHNRARMISASFLTKHLLIDYRMGEAHYLKHLTDGDWASNNLGWQWSAGCGVDAQPWFRVFNPIGQGEKFDADGAYVRRWVPELAKLSDKWIHRPWEAPPEELSRAGVQLGRSYPRPIIEHTEGRERFLAAAGGHLKGLKGKVGKPG